MRATELFGPIARDQQRRQRVDSPGDETHDVQRRVVGPVQILEHEHRRDSRPQLLDQCHRYIWRAGRPLNPLAQLAARDTRDVKQRPKGTRGGQGVTGRRQRTHPGRKLSAEVAQQRGLADTGLAVHQRQPTGRTAYGLQTRFQ